MFFKKLIDKFVLQKKHLITNKLKVEKNLQERTKLLYGQKQLVIQLGEFEREW